MFARLACCAIAAVLVACAPAFGTLRTDVPSEPRLPRVEALRILDAALRRECLRRLQCSTQVSRWSATVREDTGKGVRTVRLSLDRPLIEAKGDLIGYMIWVPAVIDGQRTAWNMNIIDKDDAQRFVDAYGDLVASHRGSTDEELYFRGQAAAWRAANPKPPLSAEGARHKVLAENAFRERRVDDAVGYYTAALDTDPAWPNGNFNLALLLAEQGEYGPAARYMRRYLLLVPESKDARVANDKVIVWEEKARRGE